MTFTLDRRDFLRTLSAGAALASISPLTLAKSMPNRDRRIIAMQNLHTGEALEVAYWNEGRYQTHALAEVNRVLRDHRTGEIHPIDKVLLDQLYLLQRETGIERPFEIISGYRSPKTNASLAQASSGVAKRSLHMQGRAMDIRLPGYQLKKLRETAMSLNAGGVGYYPRSGFIHIDTGRVRYW